MPNEQMVLDPTRVICGRHGEVFKHRWPAGYAEFCTIALECLFTQPVFGDEVSAVIEDTFWPDLTIVPQAVEHLLSKKPLCCRLPPDDLLEVYKEVNRAANVWEARRCDLCSHRREGTRYRRARPVATQPHQPARVPPPWRHVCLVCVSRSGRPLK